MANKIINIFKNNKLQYYTNHSSVAIGKKYVRSDEIGIKYAITVNPDTLIDNTGTIRERDRMEQIRVPITELMDVFNNITEYFDYV